AVIGGIDHERAALPAAARITVPLANALRQMRTAIYRDHPRFVNHLGENHHVAWGLQNLIRVVIAGWKHSSGNAARDATLPGRMMLIGIGDVRQIVVALRLSGSR